jgi:hypothetical protein
MSNYKYLDDNGLTYYHSKIKALLANKVDKVTGKGLSTNDYTTTEKNKLAGIASGAEVNQSAFSNVKVGSTTIQADTKTDTLTLTAGTNITITPDATNDKVTIATDTAIPTKVSDLTNDAGYTTNVGTVTSIATSGAITGGTITGTGTISHSTSAGYKHIPSRRIKWTIFKI